MVNLRQVRAEWHGAGTAEAISVFHFAAIPSGVDATLALVHTFLSTLSGGISSGATIILPSDTYIIDEATGAIIQEETGAAQALIHGTNTSDQLPGQVQGLISWRTGDFVAGRRLQGRTFVPGPCENESDGNPTSAYVSRTQGAATTMITAASTGEAFGVYSKTHHSFAPVLSGTAETSWATLRRRSARG